jgi:hypothetical protein
MQMSKKDWLMASLRKQSIGLVLMIVGIAVAVGVTIFLGEVVGG